MIRICDFLMLAAVRKNLFVVVGSQRWESQEGKGDPLVMLFIAVPYIICHSHCGNAVTATL